MALTGETALRNVGNRGLLVFEGTARNILAIDVGKITSIVFEMIHVFLYEVLKSTYDQQYVQ